MNLAFLVIIVKKLFTLKDLYHWPDGIFTKRINIKKYGRVFKKIRLKKY